MDRLNAMKVFAKVTALGGFAEAGRALGITRSAASKAVIELENVLGARLLDRTTRRVRPNDVGLAYYESCLDILARVEETEAQAASSRGELKGLLRVNGPTSFGTLHLGPAIADFMIAYPDLIVEMTLDDRFIDPIAQGFDVTVRIAELADSSLVARKLAPARRALVASPDYLARGRPEAPADLARHACLSYGQGAAPERWRLWRDGREYTAQVNAVLCSNNGDILRAAALAGRGIALLPTFLAGPDIAAGRLVAVLDGYAPRELGIHALYASKRYLAAKTRAFIDFLVERFGEAPEWDRYREAARSQRPGALP